MFFELTAQDPWAKKLGLGEKKSVKPISLWKELHCSGISKYNTLEVLKGLNARIKSSRILKTWVLISSQFPALLTSFATQWQSSLIAKLPVWNFRKVCFCETYCNQVPRRCLKYNYCQMHLTLPYVLSPSQWWQRQWEEKGFEFQYWENVEIDWETAR